MLFGANFEINSWKIMTAPKRIAMTVDRDIRRRLIKRRERWDEDEERGREGGREGGREERKEGREGGR